MGAVSAVLDALAVEDLFDLPAARLLDRIAELVAAQNRIAAELARTVRRAELAQAPQRDGLVSMAAWLRGHARLSPAAAGQLVRVGRAAEQLPTLAAAAAAGVVSSEQVAVAAAVTRPEHLAAAEQQAWNLARWTFCSPRSPPPARTPSCGRSSRTTWRGWIPTGPSRTRPRAGR